LEKFEDRAAAGSMLFALPGLLPDVRGSFESGEDELFRDALSDLRRRSTRSNSAKAPDGRQDLSTLDLSQIGSSATLSRSQAATNDQSWVRDSRYGTTEYANPPPHELGSFEFDTLFPPLGGGIGDDESTESKPRFPDAPAGHGSDAGAGGGGGGGGGSDFGSGSAYGPSGMAGLDSPASGFGSGSGSTSWTPTLSADGEGFAGGTPFRESSGADSPGNASGAQNPRGETDAAQASPNPAGDHANNPAASGPSATGQSPNGNAPQGPPSQPPGQGNPPGSSQHPANTPVLRAVHRIGGPDEGRLLIQGSIDADVPAGSEVRIEFFAVPVVVSSGGSAALKPFASTVIVKRNPGASTFRAVVDAPLSTGQTGVLAKAIGPFDTPAPYSKVREIQLPDDVDADGTGGLIEDLAGHAGDGNQDGIPDRQQADVASFPGLSGSIVTLDAHGKSVRNVRALKPSPAKPARIDAPFGLISFELDDVPVGGHVMVDVLLPDGAPVDVAYKQNPLTGALIPFEFDGTTGAVIDGNVVTLHLVDGGRGDFDGQANGIIVDPVLLSASGTPVSQLDAERWTSQQSGGTEERHGSIAVDGTDLVLREGDSFEVRAEQRFVVPRGVKDLQFEYWATFGAADGEFINDAFEVALVDEAGLSLVPTIRHGRDSFFNLTEEQQLAELGELTSHVAAPPPRDITAAGTVTLNVTHLADGVTPRTLIVRLVNNDSDIGTVVRILGNHAPLAVDDGPGGACELDEDGNLVIGLADSVLNNDTDADGDVLEARRTRPSDDGILYASGPYHGDLTLAADGTFTYSPDADFFGTDTFAYWAWDGLKYSEEPATVTITVAAVNDAPVAVADQYEVLLGGRIAAGNVITKVVVLAENIAESRCEIGGVSASSFLAA